MGYGKREYGITLSRDNEFGMRVRDNEISYSFIVVTMLSICPSIKQVVTVSPS